jgi:hypothetical protein
LRNNDKTEEYSLQLRNRFSALTKETTDSVKEKWDNVKDVYLKICEDVIEYKNNTNQEWISEETWDEIT